MLIFSPILLRFVWGTSVLRPGTLRTELETIAKRIGFRYSNILVWNTGGVVVNAAVTGIVPQVRYVLLSDALIQQLSPKETAAVFGHEVGHVKHHHLSYYLLFILLSILFAGLLGQWIQIQTQPWFQSFDHPWMEWFAKYTPYDAILLVPYVFFVFGMLSRRCERQADVYGSRAVSMIEPDLPPLEQILADQGFRVNEDPSSAGVLLASENVALSHERKSPRVTANGAKIFVQSLEKVAELNGMSRSAPNWRHGSIEQRIEFLERVAQDPELADRYDRAVRRFRYTLALTLMAGIVSLAWATNESFFQGETAPVKTADNVK